MNHIGLKKIEKKINILLKEYIMGMDNF